MGTTPQIIDFRERLNHVNALKGQQSTTQGNALDISNQIMSQSLSKIYLHIIFHIKTTSPSIKEEHLERVHSYIGQLVNTTGCQTLNQKAHHAKSSFRKEYLDFLKHYKVEYDERYVLSD